MQWHFSPDQVVSGAITYRLQDFRRDLMRQVEFDFPDLGDREVHGLFNLTYLLLYWLATRNVFDEFMREFASQWRPAPWLRSYVAAVSGRSSDDVEMLAGILERMTLDRIEAGFAPEIARTLVFEDHAEIAARPQASSRFFARGN